MPMDSVTNAVYYGIGSHNSTITVMFLIVHRSMIECVDNWYCVLYITRCQVLQASAKRRYYDPNGFIRQ